MNATTPKIRTERLTNWLHKRAVGKVTVADMLGRQAVVTTYDGDKLIGTITGEYQNYLVVTFDNGKWMRLGETLTLVKQA